MALFITLEGGEGAGKSVQANTLYQQLLKLAIAAVLTHEPGGTPLGDEISHWLKWTNTDIPPLTELLLFNASRSQLVDTVINPNLKNGKIVICDRFTASTTAYQGYGRGLDLKVVKTINNAAGRGLKPDLTILLDMPVAEGLARKSKMKDRFEKEGAAFHERVRQGYLALAADEPERWLVVDARQSKEEVAGLIWGKVEQMVPHQKVRG